MWFKHGHDLVVERQLARCHGDASIGSAGPLRYSIMRQSGDLANWLPPKNGQFDRFNRQEVETILFFNGDGMYPLDNSDGEILVLNVGT